jgi:hypothetical protein
VRGESEWLGRGCRWELAVIGAFGSQIMLIVVLSLVSEGDQGLACMVAARGCGSAGVLRLDPLASCCTICMCTARYRPFHHLELCLR